MRKPVTREEWVPALQQVLAGTDAGRLMAKLAKWKKGRVSPKLLGLTREEYEALLEEIMAAQRRVVQAIQALDRYRQGAADLSALTAAQRTLLAGLPTVTPVADLFALPGVVAKDLLAALLALS